MNDKSLDREVKIERIYITNNCDRILACNERRYITNNCDRILACNERIYITNNCNQILACSDLMNSLIMSVLVLSVFSAKASRILSSCSGILTFSCFKDMVRVFEGVLYCVCWFMMLVSIRTDTWLLVSGCTDK
jgi:phage FluMu protein gp41